MLRAQSFESFDHIIAFDFEFGAPPGEKPRPRCVVARELRTGQEWRVWLDGVRVDCPYPVGPRVLFVAYFASAEIGCHLVLGWPLPENIVDLFAEWRIKTNVCSTVEASPRGGLLQALRAHDLATIADEEKETMRALALRGGPYTPDEKAALLVYCAQDVDATARLFNVMKPTIHVGPALLRGASMGAVAQIEATGVPIDVPALAKMERHWDGIRAALIRRVDAAYGVFDDAGRFVAKKFEAYLEREGLDRMWPRTERGALSLDDDNFRSMAKAYPEVNDLRELRAALSALRLGDLAVGHDGRNRTLVSPFAARTGRNQPSTTKGIFGASTFLRGLIRPEQGRALAYIDFAQQEFGIAAALSNDAGMQAAYASGDPYLAFAKQAGAAPAGATKSTHAREREVFKQVVLAVQYSMGAASMAARVGRDVEGGRQLLALHRQTYPTFWRWSDAAVDTAMWTGQLHTVFGWRVRVREDARGTSLRNFPMQANGAEMLRLSCLLAHDAGVTICMPVHDALLIEADDAEIDAAVALTVKAMEDASEGVLGGYRLRAGVERIVRYPDRYSDPRGAALWKMVWDAIAEVEHER